MTSTMKESSAFQSELRLPESAIRHQSASPADKGKVTICDGKVGDEDKPKKSSVCKNIEGCREDLLCQVVRVISSFFFFCLLVSSCSCYMSLWAEMEEQTPQDTINVLKLLVRFF